MGDNVLRINVARGCQSARPGFSNVAPFYSMRFTALLDRSDVHYACIYTPSLPHKRLQARLDWLELV
jgi:hypothetical protein